MLSEIHRNEVCQNVELLLLVSILFQLIIRKSFLIFEKKLLFSSLYTFSISDSIKM